MKSILLGTPSTDGRKKQALRFDFPDSWTCINFDEKTPHQPFANPDRRWLEAWAFRASWRSDGRVEFAPRPAGLKAVDIVAFDDVNTVLYLIEATDYRASDAPSTATLPDEVAAKFRDTLAALAIGRVPAARSFHPLTDALARARDVVCVLHLELPGAPLIGPADVVDAYDRVRGIMKKSGLRTEVYSGTTFAGWDVAHVDL